MQVHVIHEIDCSVERIDPAVVEAFLDTELSDDPMLADSICAMADAMSAELHPRGVYKLFNPAICTLPPKYTEPAIKLVGTLAVLYGSAAYERMSEAEHTAMAVSTIGTDEEIACLRERLVKSDMDALLFDACLEAMASLAADKLAEAVADDAHERGLHRGSTLETGVEDFPLTMNTTLAFFTQTEKRLRLTAAEDGTPSDRWSTWGVIGLYNETQKKRRGCAYCHNVRTCTIRKIGMTCHGRRTRKKAKPTPSADQQQSTSRTLKGTDRCPFSASHFTGSKHSGCCSPPSARAPEGADRRPLRALRRTRPLRNSFHFSSSDAGTVPTDVRHLRYFFCRVRRRKKRAAGGEQHLPERFPQVDSKHKKRDPLAQAPSIKAVSPSRFRWSRGNPDPRQPWRTP